MAEAGKKPAGESQKMSGNKKTQAPQPAFELHYDYSNFLYRFGCQKVLIKIF